MHNHVIRCIPVNERLPWMTLPHNLPEKQLIKKDLISVNISQNKKTAMRRALQRYCKK